MRVKIHTSTVTGDCDDCGYYEVIDWVIEKDGEEVGSLYYDGHLGGGVALYDPEVAVAEVLKLLGYEVEVVDEG